LQAKRTRALALITGLALTMAMTSACRRPGQPGTTTTTGPTTAPTTATTRPPGSTATTATTAPRPTTTSTRPPTPVPSSGLATSGRKIVDRSGREVILQGVNWFGFETGTRYPHGLWTRDYVDMLKQMKALGYNTVRLPFSQENYRYNQPVSGINTSNGMNAGLNGKTPAQLMELIVAEAGRQGLYVFLDNHSAANDGYQSPFWYDGSHTDADWISMWRDVARQFAKYGNVVGADLKNEPHGKANENGSNWGEGGPNDWWSAATRAGNTVLAEAPNWLIIVEGIERPVPGGTLQQNWWGGNLEGVKTKPVVLNVANRVVYSPHEYGPGVYAQPWFSDPSTMSAALASRWSAGFGYIVDQNIAPVLMGEFGAKNFDTSSTEGKWMNQLIDYLGAKKMSWTYWSWNPDSGDTGGILNDDWTTVNQTKQTALNRLLAVKP
jgi:endoglucanase